MKAYKIILLAIMAFVSACSNDDDVTAYQDALEIKGVQAIIDNEVPTTRSASEKTETAVGRTTFITGDHIVFTTIKRTESPLASFTYSDIRYYYTDKKSWKRTEGNLPEKIYWTDGASAHTFIGYSLPAEDYHWVDNGNGTYSGELGYEKEVIDFTAGNDEIQKEDLLLDYNTKTVAETGGLSTKVSFTHALSCVRVEVNISNFASSASAVDTKVGVSNMILLNQPTKFTWGGNSNKLKVLDFEDQTTKNFKLWCPVPAGEGTGQSKTFTFYGLTTPQDDTFHNINGNDLPLMFSFTVTYPNPLNPDETLTKTYKGSFSQLVNFHSGMCTTLNISLNHKDEQMYMGVEYNDWNYVATPDLGALRKKSTFMDINSTVTIHTDANATVDDATWLYQKGGALMDIYGNNGDSRLTPYRITSASQLLSFAKEVKAGVDFKDKFIRLDADITMQSSTAKTSAEDSTATLKAVEWISIGDADHAFNGTFLGGDRYINRLNGNPLFAKLGPAALVEQLYITSIGSITGGGALVDSNEGVIGGCKVVDDVITTGGALIGTNTGTVYASYYTGETVTTQLVGTNNGKMVGCYQSADIASFDESLLVNLVERLNNELTAWYKDNAYTRFFFVYLTASYPTVQKQ
ncbi:fimbrillin family protein [Prevotella communis]|uniref:fimbrillin family protein n=1 Tax=Prevotella communis TaxID=2913614 RepID=UPI001EDC728D|nr:fimbrillin family protein [Prevotella communis]UKK57181.1 fimbrillin family protein [Prevotella communis]